MAYEFAWEMAGDLGAGEWARGEGEAYLYFERRALRSLLKDFAVERGLAFSEEAAVWLWVESLPWTEFGTLEVHFSW